MKQVNHYLDNLQINRVKGKAFCLTVIALKQVLKKIILRFINRKKAEIKDLVTDLANLKEFCRTDL